MLRTFVAGCALLAVACRSGDCDTGAPQKPIPLSQVLEQLSQNEQVREKLLESLDRLPNAWGLIGPNERTRLRDYILNRNWSAIDHFPALTISQLRASVAAAKAAARRYSFGGDPLSPPYVEVGSFATNTGGETDWIAPPSDSNKDLPPIKDLGYGLTMGDPPHPELWKWHAQSERTAYLLNRLALNAALGANAQFAVRLGERVAHSPEKLIAALSQSGCDVRVEDARYFANFGHLHFHSAKSVDARPESAAQSSYSSRDALDATRVLRGSVETQDVLMPFWLNTRLRIPGSSQSLLVPVTHAEEEIRIRCPRGNADVAFYFGIDGMAEFRTMDTLDQYWVGKNAAHVFRNDQAIEVTRLLAATLRTYAELHRAHPDLPFRGYYALGVCQDAVAAIEKRLTSAVTLFPITHDPQYFRGSGEIERLFASLPDDRNDSHVDWARVRGSLPASDLHDIRIPQLRQTLLSFEAKENEIRRERAIGIPSAVVAGCAVVLFLWTRRRRRSRKPSAAAA